jgi:hypothetical protein
MSSELATVAALEEGQGLPGCTGGRPQWRTSSFGHSSDTTPLELSELGEHLQQCQGGNRHLRTLHNSVQTLHGFVAPRFVSTLAALLLVLGALLVLV